MSRAVRLAAVTAALAALVAAGPAVAASTPPPAPPATPAPAPWATGAPTAELERKLAEQQATAEAEQGRLGRATAAANAALEAAQKAQRDAEAAARAFALAYERHEQAKVRTANASRQLGTFANSLYRRGGHSGEAAWYLGVVGGTDPAELLGNLDLASRVGEHNSAALEDLRQAEADQARAARTAEKAVAQQRAANARAAQTKVAADRVVAEAQAAVAASHAALVATVGEVADARRRDALLAKAEAIARQRASVPFEAIAGALTPRPGATCTGGVLKGYPNGVLPEVALCPLWGTSGQMLRADAAAAFDEMSRAYALEFGLPICVTDSYRSLPEQVAVRQAKPTLAAVPGTSNHGWAVAVDLCDGVQTFGSPQHEWMRANSLRFGWFHPAWAQQGGSKPEAWHWEFAG